MVSSIILTFTVRDIDAMYAKLKKHNVELIDRAQTIFNDHRILFFYGPDGEIGAVSAGEVKG